MTDQEYAKLGSAFMRYLLPYRQHMGEIRAAFHLENYCRGLLSDAPRKTVEPLALRSGTTVRALQVFLKDGEWDHLEVGHDLQRRLANAFADEPDPDGFGTIGLIDETSCVKQGDQTPGVRRQYLGCVGKIENGIVTVHLGAVRSRLQALFDADLFLPKVWSEDRERCQKAGIPDPKQHEPKWKLALGQYTRACQNGFVFDWLVFDAGYGNTPTFLRTLNQMNQRFVGEIPLHFWASRHQGGPKQKVREMLLSNTRRGGKRLRIDHGSGDISVWSYRSMVVFAAGRRQRLIVAIKSRTNEVKYFLSNAVSTAVKTVLRVGLRRAPVEHLFRLAKQEVGLMHFEGRSYQGLMRHLILALVTLGFVSLHTAKLQKKRGADDGAGVPRVECVEWGMVTPPTRHLGEGVHPGSHSLPPGTQCHRETIQAKTESV